MSTQTNYHIHHELDKAPLLIDSHISSTGQTAILRLTKGVSVLSVFFDSLEDIEKVGAELITLGMQIRMEGWKGGE